MAHLTALEQQREDQALGAAWRRCEALDPSVGVVAWGDGRYYASSDELEGPFCLTPTQALEALADALEARRAAE